jgi:hypothetical protein
MQAPTLRRRTLLRASSLYASNSSLCLFAVCLLRKFSPLNFLSQNWHLNEPDALQRQAAAVSVALVACSAMCCSCHHWPTDRRLLPD